MSTTLRDLLTCGHDRRARPDAQGRIAFAATGLSSIARPLVSEHLYREGFRPTYPGGAPFAVCVSHNVDRLMMPTFRAKLGALRRNEVARSSRNVAGLFRRYVDRRYTVEHLLTTEASLEIRSAFHFLGAAPGHPGPNYGLDEIADQLAFVREDRCEIALLGGPTAYNDAGSLAWENHRMLVASGAQVAGYRDHYLRYDPHRTWSPLRHETFTYDSSCGYLDQAGFRNGMCHPHRPLDPHTGRFLPIVELPVVIMDTTVLQAMGLDIREAMALCQQLVLAAKACAGVVTIVWHNHAPDPAWGRFYRDLIMFCRAQDAWFATGKELVEHWMDSGHSNTLETMIKELIDRS
ncbi:MAG: hypothetical protein QM724_12890 [Flavobacteriales bacterium]